MIFYTDVRTEGWELCLMGRGEKEAVPANEDELAGALADLSAPSSPMRPYYRQPALRLMSPHQFRALSASLAQPFGERLDSLRMD
jgi:hypothetical protein